MRYIRHFFIYLFCFMVQHTLLGSADIAGTSPDLILVLTLVITFCSGTFDGIIYGTVCGLAADILWGTAVGVYGSLYFIIGVTMVILRRVFADDSRLILIAITGVSTIVCYAGASMLTNIITGMGPGMILAMSHVPVAIILNCIAIMWIAPFFDRKSGYAA